METIEGGINWIKLYGKHGEESYYADCCPEAIFFIFKVAIMHQSGLFSRFCSLEKLDPAASDAIRYISPNCHINQNLQVTPATSGDVVKI